MHWAYPAPLREEIARRVRYIALETNQWKQTRESLESVEVILSSWGMPKMTPEFLDRFPSLRGVFYAAGDVKPFVTEASQERDITVCSAREANAIPVAEYTCAVIFLSLKRFWYFHRTTHQNRSWKREVPDAIGGYNTCVGLVSLGAVGRRVARTLANHELQVMVYDPYISREEAAEVGATLTTLEDLFSECDVISVHTPWLQDTEGMINASLFEMMKPNATLINTSRGAVVNEPDLISVLAQRHDLTAVLDVTWPEPPPKDTPLFTMPNVILTPHIAGSLGTEVTRMGRWMTDDMFRFLDGLPLEHQVPLRDLNGVA